MKKFVKSLAFITAISLAFGGFMSCSNGSDDGSKPPVQPQDPVQPHEPIEQDNRTSVTNLKVAPLVHHGDTEISEGLYAAYSYSAHYKNADTSKIFVTLTATDLIRHTNGQRDGVTAYWVGIAIPKDGTALKARTYFEGATEKGNFEDAGIEWTEGGVTYNTFYFGSYDGSFAKKGIVEISESESAITKTYEITFNVRPKQIIFAKISHTAQEIVDFYKNSAQNAKSGWNSYYFSITGNDNVTYVDRSAQMAGTSPDGDVYYSDVQTVSTTDNDIETVLSGKKILFDNGNCETYKKDPWPLIFVDKGALLAGATKTTQGIYDMKNIKVSCKINSGDWTETACDTLTGCNNAITLYLDKNAANGIQIPESGLKSGDKIQLKFELYDDSIGNNNTSHKIAEVVTDAYTAVTTINLNHGGSN